MKSALRFLSALFLLLIVQSCSRDRKSDPAPGLVEYKVTERSAFFNKNNITFTIDSMDNTLFIHLSIIPLKNFPYPVNYKYKDTLTKTAFNFDLYCNGKLIKTDYRNLQRTITWRQDSSEAANDLCLCTDTVDLRQGNELMIAIPFYAFHNLKKGKQAIELNMWQKVFTDQVHVTNKDKTFNSYYIQAERSLFNARVKFDINIPPIYQTYLYGEGLKLKNDSTFSPAGMDNTLWNSSYPDIYWAVYYPNNKFYTQTPYESSTDEYTAHDTFKLYHYYREDSLGLGVYDHDNLSRDDGLGFWDGSLRSLKNASITFGNVKTFNIRTKESGVIN